MVDVVVDDVEMVGVFGNDVVVVDNNWNDDVVVVVEGMMDKWKNDHNIVEKVENELVLGMWENIHIDVDVDVDVVVVVVVGMVVDIGKNVVVVDEEDIGLEVDDNHFPLDVLPHTAVAGYLD